MIVELRPAGAPVTPSVPVIVPDPTTVQLVQRTLARIAADVDAINLEIAYGYTATAIHTARVAIRRARADLRMLRPLVDTDWIDARRRELRPLGGALADVRHIDTLLGYLQRATDESPGITADATAIAHRLFDARDEAINAARFVARSLPVVSARRALQAGAITPPLRPGGADLATPAAELAISLVGRPRRKVRAAAAHASRHPDAPLEPLRVSARYLRYAAEAVVEVAPDAEVVGGAASVLHEALGDLADGASVRDFLAGPPAGITVSPGLSRVLRDIIDDDDAVARRAWPFALELALEAPVRHAEEIAPILAAGGVVCRAGHNGLEVLLVHRPKYDDWSLPKGQCLPGELFEIAAQREVEEETGLRCRVVAKLGTVDYRNRHGRPKHAVFFVMEPEAAEPANGGPRVLTAEVDAIAWMPWRDARDAVRRGRDRRLITMVATTDLAGHLPN